jgi:hypothetical protein
MTFMHRAQLRRDFPVERVHGGRSSPIPDGRITTHVTAALNTPGVLLALRLALRLHRTPHRIHVMPAASQRGSRATATRTSESQYTFALHRRSQPITQSAACVLLLHAPGTARDEDGEWSKSVNEQHHNSSAVPGELHAAQLPTRTHFNSRGAVVTAADDKAAQRQRDDKCEDSSHRVLRPVKTLAQSQSRHACRRRRLRHLRPRCGCAGCCSAG